MRIRLPSLLAPLPSSMLAQFLKSLPWFTLLVASMASVAVAQDEQPAETQTETADKQVAESEPAAAPKGIVDFAKDIAPLLKSECSSCHQGDKAKGGFIVSDRDAVLGYIEPKDAAASSLWTDYLVQPAKSVDSESLVMPPDGPLAPEKLALLKLWIDEGAEWPVGVTLAGEKEDASSNPTEPATVGGTFWDRAYRAVGYFHPAVVHFPIALFIVSGACSFLSYFLGKRCESMAFHCLWIATLSTIAAVVMGWSFADQRGYPAWNQSLGSNASHEDMTFFYHRWVGSLLLVLSMVVVVIGLFSGNGETSRLRNVWKVGAMLLALMVSIVGHQGGELVYGEIFDKAMEQFSK
ncbi:MAG: hypothetical protein MUD03_03540 [Pirellula sp.]|nr:hypothetical protein [Pirellula sp.]